MIETYFTRFPIIAYSNTDIRDLSRRVVLDNKIRNVPTVFYPYDIEHDQRSDMVAENYYKDPDLDWLIYLTNGIIDPYYGWYLTEEEFDKFIIKKYGGLDIAQQKIAYWTTNWMDNDINVTPGFFSRLIVDQQKYYQPVWGPKKIMAYKRREESWTTNTNKIMDVTVANSDPFAIGDLIQSVDSLENIIGTGEVAGIIPPTDVDDGILQVQHVIDHWDDTVETVQLRNDETANSAVSEITEFYVNIADTEAVFWTPIYNYDMERETNEARKTIMLLDPSYVQPAARALTNLLRDA